MRILRIRSTGPAPTQRDRSRIFASSTARPRAVSRATGTRPARAARTILGRSPAPHQIERIGASASSGTRPTAASAAGRGGRAATSAETRSAASHPPAVPSASPTDASYVVVAPWAARRVLSRAASSTIREGVGSVEAGREDNRPSISQASSASPSAAHPRRPFRHFPGSLREVMTQSVLCQRVVLPERLWLGIVGDWRLMMPASGAQAKTRKGFPGTNSLPARRKGSVCRRVQEIALARRLLRLLWGSAEAASRPQTSRGRYAPFCFGRESLDFDAAL